MLHRSQDVQAVTPFHDSSMAVIAQHHLLFFVSIQKVESVEPINNRLYRADRDEATAVGDAVVAKRGVQISR